LLTNDYDLQYEKLKIVYVALMREVYNIAKICDLTP